MDEVYELLKGSQSPSAEQRQLYFLQQALYEINKIAGLHTEVEATVWLTKGDHYFFQCSELVSADAPKTPLDYDRLCQFQSLKAFYPKTDNVKLVVRALRCDSQEASSIKEAKSDMTWFKNNCVANDSERPIVSVNAPNFYFNITKEAIFEDVIFDAINTFSHAFVVDQNGRRVSGQRTPYWPMKMCELDVGKSFKPQANSTPLLDLIEAEISNSSISPSMKKGYGYMPLRSLFTESDSRLLDAAKKV